MPLRGSSGLMVLLSTTRLLSVVLVSYWKTWIFIVQILVEKSHSTETTPVSPWLPGE